MVGRGLRGQKVGGTEDVNLIDIRINFEKFGSLSGAAGIEPARYPLDL